MVAEKQVLLNWTQVTQEPSSADAPPLDLNRAVTGLLHASNRDGSADERASRGSLNAAEKSGVRLTE